MGDYHSTEFIPRLETDAQGMIPLEQLNTMVDRGQAARAALRGLGWVVPCRNPNNPGCEEVMIIGTDRRIKIEPDCPLLRLAGLIPTQGQPQDSPSEQPRAA